MVQFDGLLCSFCFKKKQTRKKRKKEKEKRKKEKNEERWFSLMAFVLKRKKQEKRKKHVTDGFIKPILKL